MKKKTYSVPNIVNVELSAKNILWTLGDGSTPENLTNSASIFEEEDDWGKSIPPSQVKKSKLWDD